MVVGTQVVISLFSGTTSTELAFLPLLASLLSGAFAISLLFFLFFHLHLILTGQTTIEAKLNKRRRGDRMNPNSTNRVTPAAGNINGNNIDHRINLDTGDNSNKSKATTNKDLSSNASSSSTTSSVDPSIVDETAQDTRLINIRNNTDNSNVASDEDVPIVQGSLQHHINQLTQGGGYQEHHDYENDDDDDDGEDDLDDDGNSGYSVEDEELDLDFNVPPPPTYEYRANFEAVFGRNPWLWFVPIDTLEETGYELEWLEKKLGRRARARRHRQARSNFHLNNNPSGAASSSHNAHSGANHPSNTNNHSIHGMSSTAIQLDTIVTSNHSASSPYDDHDGSEINTPEHSQFRKEEMEQVVNDLARNL